MANVLIIDDDPLVCNMLVHRLSQMEHTAVSMHTLQEGLALAFSRNFDLILLDIGLPDGNGLDSVSELMNSPSLPEVIIMTGSNNEQNVERAIRSGAWEFFSKDNLLEQVNTHLRNAVRYREDKRGMSVRSAAEFPEITARSKEMRSCLEVLSEVAQSDINILITGETGTGKELIAGAVHKNSSRAQGPFIVVDCAALPENLVESMLLGHEKGSFTGADARRDGLIKQADGGTLFLDEIGELPLVTQRVFLRVLQERRFRPIGSRQEVTSNFRLIAATNRNLEDMVNRGEFREDLLFRLKAATVRLPALRERRDDIEELARHFTEKRCAEWSVPQKALSPEFIAALSSYGWPGNVRELIHAIDAAIVKAKGDSVLLPVHLPLELRVETAKRFHTGLPADTAEKGKDPARRFPTIQEAREQIMLRAEKQYLLDLLDYTAGSIKKACDISGLSRSRFYVLLKKHGITRQHEWLC
ncbi:MAG TPA: sigma-54 dependent transcriptional regulator [Oligoflexia bacterium]|nr:sigma-54 dependent transcriptional regulator [Oligoflexia bacterium]